MRSRVCGGGVGRYTALPRTAWRATARPRAAWRTTALLGIVWIAHFIWVGMASPAYGWGFVAHRVVSKKAMEATPGALGVFLRSHAEILEDRSLDPDAVLKDGDPEEARRHFVNLDAYASTSMALSGLPRSLQAAERRFGSRRLHRNGVLPWWIAECASRLTEAMRRGSTDEILKEAGYLSHYVADLHQPLHLTRNYDGRASGNSGIHAVYEALMIERFARSYRAVTSRATTDEPPADPADWAIRRAGEVFPKAALILAADTSSRRIAGKDEAGYLRELDARLRPMTQTLLRAASEGTALLWQGAWRGADRPDPERWTVRKTVLVPAGTVGE